MMTAQVELQTWNGMQYGLGMSSTIRGGSTATPPDNQQLLHPVNMVDVQDIVNTKTNVGLAAEAYLQRCAADRLEVELQNTNPRGGGTFMTATCGK